jgi:hypothetical protein
MNRPVAVLACVAALAFEGATALARGQSPEPSRTAAAAPAETDIVDLIRAVRRKGPADRSAPAWDYRRPMIAVMPTLSSKPSTGFTVGALANVAFYRGDPATTGISAATMGATVSSRKQVSLSARLHLFTRENRFNIQGDNRFLWTSQDTFGLGPETAPDDAVNVRFDHVRISDIGYLALRPRVYAGIGPSFNVHRDVEPGEGADAAWDTSPYVEYSRANGLPVDSQTSSGLAMGVLVATRDNVISARRGWLASVTYRPFFEAMGSDSAWQELLFDARSFLPVRGHPRHRIALWLYGDFVVAGVAPYFDLPSTGNDVYGRAGRGYVEGRFRGERLVYGEMEYRGTLTANGLLGMVAFVNLTTVSGKDTGQSLFDDAAPGTGVGLRVLMNKRAGTNICIDVGVGRQGSKGLYLGLQEVF